MNSKNIKSIPPKNSKDMRGAGVIYKDKEYITHTTLHTSHSAIITTTKFQKLAIFLLAVLLVLGCVINLKLTAIIIVGLLSAVYFLDLFFSLYLTLKSLNSPPEINFDNDRLKNIDDTKLPVYSVLCPLYKESRVLPQFVNNINRLDYPKSKLDVILLLEQDDKETRKAAKMMELPDYIRVVVVPTSEPKTKPKACNYGLAYARGEYVVIYDAEDEPEPSQLKKAFLAFKSVPANVFCLQAKLNYYNPNQNLLTRLFTAEYSLWFEMILPGLQSINTTIPLGGTSNHFRTSDLKNIKGWDPFNVTEDADLGIRLFKAGYRTAIIDSITLEEANSNVKNWIRQRSRWIKGYLQTYLVHMRHPIKFIREHREHYFIFQLISGLRISFAIINPLLWIMTLSYFLLYKFVGPQIKAIYPAPVFYIAVISAVFGNFLALFYYMIGAAKRGNWNLIKYVYLIPFYWALTSYAAGIAIYQIIFKPHFWEKTIHGLHMNVRIEKGPGFNFKKYFTPEIVSGGLLVFSIILGNFFGFLYNAYLGRTVSLEDFGLLSLFGSFIYISQVFTSSISRTFIHKSAYLFGRYGGTVKQLWFFYRKKLIKISLIVMVVWLILSPFFVGVFKSEGIAPFIIFAPVWIMSIVGALDVGLLTGSLQFVTIAILTLVEPIIKFVLTVVIVRLGHDDLAYLSIPLSMAVSFFIAFKAARALKGVEGVVNLKVVFSFPKKFFATSLLAKTATIVFLSLDLVAAKIFLSPDDAGNYAILSTVGKMVFFLSTLFIQFVVPYASKEYGEGSGENKSFNALFGLTAASTFVGVLVFGVFGKYTGPFLMGPNTQAVVPYLLIFCIGIALHSISSILAAYYQAKKRYEYPVVQLIFSSVTLIAFFFYHSTIYQFAMIMLIGGAVDLAGVVILHIFYDEYTSIVRNFLDLLGLFRRHNLEALPEGKFRILVFNWRDVQHIWSGGAEVYVHELAKRWVKNGHSVTLFCGNDGKSLRNEEIDGVGIIRRGGFYTVYVWAFLYYIFKFRGHYDTIIDSENGIPFFAPLYAKEKIFLLIHHVHQEVFRLKLKPPLSWIGQTLERYVMPLVYRKTEVITVSPSSKADILEYGLTQKEPHIIYNGVDTNIYKPGQKSPNPLVLYLGRLTAQKSIHVLIEGAGKIIEKIPSVEFVIAGDGTEKENLVKLTEKLNLQKKITFTGKVSEQEKVELYQKAWVFVNPSLIEGWGITTIEANACGTPVVASNVAGLRDAVKNPHSGILIPYGNTDELAKSTVRIIKDRKIRNRMSSESVLWAKKFDWAKSAENFLKFF